MRRGRASASEQETRRGHVPQRGDERERHAEELVHQGEREGLGGGLWRPVRLGRLRRRVLLSQVGGPDDVEQGHHTAQQPRLQGPEPAGGEGLVNVSSDSML